MKKYLEDIIIIILVIAIIFMIFELFNKEDHDFSMEFIDKSLSERDLNVYLEKFDGFKGEQDGKDVKTMLNRVMELAANYADLGKFYYIPAIKVNKEIDPMDKLMGFIEVKKSADKEPFIESIMYIKTHINDDDKYVVDYTYSKAGTIDFISIDK